MQWTKTPADILWFGLNWSRWLLPDETIVSHVLEIGDEIVLVDTNHTESTVRFKVSGGAIGDSAAVSIIVVTSGGSTYQASGRIAVRERRI